MYFENETQKRCHIAHEALKQICNIDSLQFTVLKICLTLLNDSDNLSVHVFFLLYKKRIQKIIKLFGSFVVLHEKIKIDKT
jgi:hypothetical protein